MNHVEVVAATLVNGVHGHTVRDEEIDGLKGGEGLEGTKRMRRR